MNSRLMYIEPKSGDANSSVRIGRVTVSKSGRSIHYREKMFQSLPGQGFVANYYDTQSGEQYWIAEPKREGTDQLDRDPRPIEIDDDSREEYWLRIRNKPAKINQSKI